MAQKRHWECIDKVSSKSNNAEKSRFAQLERRIYQKITIWVGIIIVLVNRISYYESQAKNNSRVG